jgi:hypothetical protein
VNAIAARSPPVLLPANRKFLRLCVARHDRKNFLFAGNDDFGERAATAFTILGCCRIVGVNPVEYLADVPPRLARPVRLRDLPDLLPHRWKARRDAAAAFSMARAQLAS